MNAVLIYSPANFASFKPLSVNSGSREGFISSPWNALIQSALSPCLRIRIKLELLFSLKKYYN